MPGAAGGGEPEMPPRHEVREDGLQGLSLQSLWICYRSIGSTTCFFRERQLFHSSLPTLMVSPQQPHHATRNVRQDAHTHVKPE